MKRLKQKRFEIPATVSGRAVTNRGVHLQPSGYHGMWLDQDLENGHWTRLLQQMGISWAVILTEGDSVLEQRGGTCPLKALLDAGVIPIIRDKRSFPSSFVNVHTVRGTVELYAHYGLRPFWQLYNEPFDKREWKGLHVPKYEEAWPIIARCWSEGARQVVDAGAYVGFPDGPCYAENPFERLRPAGGLDVFEEGLAFYAPHNYGLGRPLWYPYDAVSRHGAALTEEAYRRLLDDFADDPHWYDVPVEMINQQRQEWADPARTAKADDTCWRGWEKIVHWALDSLGYVPPLAMTEGGWTPRARAGIVPVDNRWSYATPKMVAKKTLQMYDTPSPFFAVCPWLLATDDMGGAGWYDDGWHGGAFSDKYGSEKPVITVLKEIPPKEVSPRTRPRVIEVNGDYRTWTWLKETYGASYRRGSVPEPSETSPPVISLIEVHEYEGPATWDVTVVDVDGLPVEGVEFCHHYPGAPLVAGDEWYKRAVLQKTNVEGRISFPAHGAPSGPGQGAEAIWPRGKGDVLERLGLLRGTRNRHLNAVWQLVKGSAEPADSGEEKGEGKGEEPDEGTGGWQMEVEYRPGVRILAGTLPRQGISVTISDPWGNSSTVTSGSKPEHGPGGFEVLAPHIAAYTLAFLDQSFQVQTHDGATFVTLSEAESGKGGGTRQGGGARPGEGAGQEVGQGQGRTSGGWHLEVEYRPGVRILAGTLPCPGISVTVSDPWGNSSTVTSGSKPEHGPGGFEVLAPNVTTYTLAFLDRSFQVQTHDGATFVTLSKAGPPPTESEKNRRERRPPAARGNKLGFYVEASSRPGLADAIHAVQPPIILTHANDRSMLQAIRRELSPDSFVVGRLPVERGEQDAWLRSGDPEGAGEALADRVLGLDMGLALERGPHGRLLIDAWTSLNECLPGPASDAWKNGSPGERQSIRRVANAYDRFMVGFRSRLKAVDSELEAVAFNFAAGNFPDALGYLEWFPATLKEYIYLGFHEYGWPALSSQLHPDAASSAGTYRTIMSGIRRRYGRRHRAVITEAGLARMYKYPTSEAGDVGWLYPGEPIRQADYWKSLKWYNDHMGQHDYVLGACLFEVGHGGRWETFRHLGIDNAGNPIRIIPRIQELGQPNQAAVHISAPAEGGDRTITLAGQILGCGEPVTGAVVRLVGAADTLSVDPEAVACNPGAVEWSQSLTGFEGSLWNCWRKLVSRSVAGITWEEFRAQAGSYNPSLHESGYRLLADRTYRLPRNVGQERYRRVALSDAQGWYRFERLRGGRYDLEVAAQGYQPLRQEIEVDPATRCYLEMVPAA